MPILGDVLQVVLEQTFLEQVIRNVFGYIVSVADPTATMTEIADRIRIDVGDVYMVVQVPAVSAVQVALKNLDNEDEFVEIDWSGSGLSAGSGPGMPSYVATGFKLLRGDVDTRNGSKRFVGVGEDHVTDNNWNNFEGLAVIDIEDALAATLTITPSIMEIDPIIIGRDPITGLPDTGRIAPVSEAQAQPLITTQNSRKAGRGE